ncbi:hypothetical protein Bca52824_064003 [Brassica carinata]|uniref:Acid phosphatase/vanadium-dependent haloperoxidase-related protein n=2 Tax=Brassica TaxID=3705 RepID=A0A8X7QK55_BRACI|nr:hypothetical protein Bca52824_064003 [Brassica carinata]VDD43762.1 unnamed protein product [Brassica oleracea]
MEEPTATTTSKTHYFSIFTNKPSLLSRYNFHSHSIHQTLFTSWYRERRWDLRQLLGSGGMPSSHSSTVTLAVEIGLQEGFGGSHFAITLILASVVMYDATSVRLHAGRQAEVLNQIVFELPAEHPLATSRWNLNSIILIESIGTLVVSMVS